MSERWSQAHGLSEVKDVNLIMYKQKLDVIFIFHLEQPKLEWFCCPGTVIRNTHTGTGVEQFLRNHWYTGNCFLI